MLVDTPTDARPLTNLERNALDFLLDRNIIQRNVSERKSGKKVVTERDISGGVEALIALLRATDEPLHSELRNALANALSPSPLGRSILTIQKRLRRGPGRPPKRDAEKAYAIHVSRVGVERARAQLERDRPIPAVGLKAKAVSKKEAIKATKFGRTATYENQKALDSFHRKYRKS
jgi:hypothetical protein